MTYFIYITLPLIMGAALVAAWLRVLPYLAIMAFLIFVATWLFG